MIYGCAVSRNNFCRKNCSKFDKGACSLGAPRPKKTGEWNPKRHGAKTVSKFCCPYGSRKESDHG